jgi:hypothetical protein
MKHALGKLLLSIAARIALRGFRMCGADTKDMCVQLALMLKPELAYARVKAACDKWDAEQARQRAQRQLYGQDDPSSSHVRQKDWGSN